MRLVKVLGLTGLALLAFLLSSCGGGSTGSSANNLPNAPVAAFTFSPASPAVNQTVQFTDASTGGATGWSWGFGDNATSYQQNPTHTYTASGTFTVSLTATNSGGSRTATQSVTVSPAQVQGTFQGTVVLGAPTANTIRLSIFSATQSGTVSIQYGTAPGAYSAQTSASALVAGTPLVLTLNSLAANTPYYYRLSYQGANNLTALTGEYRFHTARPSGSTFTFTIQADLHLDENSSLAQYQKTLANVAADAPDFHIDLGDTFMCEKTSTPLVANTQPCADVPTVDARYQYERGNFGLISPSVPLFLVNGNHEGEAGWLANGTANNLAVWTTDARHAWYLNPPPDSFYSGDSVTEAFVGQRASWYSWQWGDALFVVLDPYWNTTVKNLDGWTLSLGQRQYQWLQSTLSTSTARYKFILIHSLVGGLDGQYRGGIEAAPYFEWGGKNLDGTDGFAAHRSGWAMPIHQLLLQNKVTAVFHGHDHLYAKQMLDGLIYQEVPQPSALNNSSGASLASQYHYAAGTILSSSGHMRVTVSPANVQMQYVRAWLPADETATRKNGEIADAWTAVSSVALPGASFTYSTVAPVAGQSVQFADSSSNSPTSWSWDFGDGSTGNSQNPAHAFATAGTFTVQLTATNAAGSSSSSRSLAVAAGTSGFGGNVVLGSPTANSIKANIYSPYQGGTVFIAYGGSSGTYDRQTSPVSLTAATPLELSLDSLTGNNQYFYRLYYRTGSGSTYAAGPEYSFRTARTAGNTFVFAVQGDSHPERANTQFDSTLYTRTLTAVAADRPDFYLTIGDDFSVDTLDPTTINAAQVTARYTLQRPYLGIVGASAPVFLTNGNHEQAARYLLDGTANNVAVWAQNARNSLYSQPAPGSFYTGNTESVPNIGLLRNYFAWTWGDALFVVIDPYWESPVCVDEPFGGGTKRSNLWDVTHGDAQFQWLKTTLENSTAKYKLVFAHHVLGTQRGGIEVAGQYEWGGQNGNGTWGFAANRPTWSLPIQQLMAANKVTIFFQGHDHIWVRQQQDGVTYQTLSEPADPNYSLFNSDAYLTGDKFPNTGYTRVTVAPTGVKVEYVRTYLPADESPTQVSGSVAFSYTVP